MNCPNRRIALPLIADREPFLLIERAKISIRSGHVVATKGSSVINLPTRQTFLIIVGNGCSITTEAAIQISKDGCNLAYARGGCNIHTTFVSQQYKDPQRLLRQLLKRENPETRMAMATQILRLKFSKQSMEHYSVRLNSCTSIEEILGVEGAAQREWYHNHFVGFKRNYKSGDLLNKQINIVNSILYNFISSIIVCLGNSPSVGFLHGKTRRGALALDIADIFKSELLIHALNSREGNIVRACFDYFNDQKKRRTRSIIEIVERLCT